MILVDTSIWVDHLRRSDDRLVARLGEGEVLMHPAVVGELALGRIARREVVLESLRRLPRATVARDAEVLALIERERLAGSGIGWADAHLLSAVRLTPGARLWTRDRRLAAVGERLGVV